MNKIAQRRGILNRLREKANSPGEAVSGVFSPEFARLMDTLREVDDDAREQAADLKDMLKVARSNFNRREYMTTIAYLGKFHERLEKINKAFDKLDKEINASHNEFLFGDLDDEHKKYLFETMPERFKPKAKAPAPAAKADDGLEKEAGIKDWWHNLTSERGKALKYWEKRFPKAAKEIKRQTEKMLNRSEMFLNLLLATFKTLASHRATRKLEDYIKVAAGLTSKYSSYNDAFNEYFNNSVRKFVESQREFEAAKKSRESELTGEEKKEESPDSEESVPTVENPIVNEKSVSSPHMSTKEVERSIDEEIAEMEKNNEPAPFPKPNSSKHEYMEVLPEEIMESVKPSSEPPSSSPFPLVQRKTLVPNYVPLGFSPENTAPKTNVTENVVSPPTMRSPVLPGALTTPPGEIYQQPIPKSPKMPNVFDLEQPLTPEQESRFYYYEQPSPTPTPSAVSGLTTVRPPVKTTEVPPVTERRSPETVGYPIMANEFMEKIQKIGTENPFSLSIEVIKFAKSIEKLDKATSDRLILVARNLLK